LYQPDLIELSAVPIADESVVLLEYRKRVGDRRARPYGLALDPAVSDENVDVRGRSEGAGDLVLGRSLALTEYGACHDGRTECSENAVPATALDEWWRGQVPKAREAAST
jgi:hypothetical protein